MAELIGGGLDMVTNPIGALECIKYIFYITNLVCLLHVPATLMTILRKVRYRGWTYRDITEVRNQCTDIKYHVLKIHGLKYVLIFKILEIN
jgi:hypothetical protein